MVITHDVDILALTELNKRWSAIPEENTIWSAINKWKEHARTYASYNKQTQVRQKDYMEVLPYRYSMKISSIQKKGEDHRGWGRWNWVELQGKNNMNTTIISAYCPCISDSPTQYGHNIY